MDKLTKEQRRKNMQAVKSRDSKIELILRKALWAKGYRYRKNYSKAVGKPDIAFVSSKIAIFCDSEFWHGYDWEQRKDDIKSNREFWIRKIESNITRDTEVNTELKEQGWTVIRFWGSDLRTNFTNCVNIIETAILEKSRESKQIKYKTLDLFAGIGGIRRGFELTGRFENVLSAEIDKYACQTYRHLFGDDPYADATSEDFKARVAAAKYDVILAGFPCQAFSIAGRKEGFKDKTRGTLFFDIADILERTRPKAFLLENVEGLLRHHKGQTFRTILETLTTELGYKVVCAEKSLIDGYPIYNPSDFLINSRNFGVPQNRPRVYIMGFDSRRYGDIVHELPLRALPKKRIGTPIYSDLDELLEYRAEPEYYLSEGYLLMLKRHREKHEAMGHGFGYIVVNAGDTKQPVSNAILAIGGSGRERNLIYDPQENIAGKCVKAKKTPLNKDGIRVMTPREWGKLQGFVGYAFMKNGRDEFSFPERVSRAQQYIQFGNSVTIPVIETLAGVMAECLDYLEEKLNCEKRAK